METHLQIIIFLCERTSVLSLLFFYLSRQKMILTTKESEERMAMFIQNLRIFSPDSLKRSCHVRVVNTTFPKKL